MLQNLRFHGRRYATLWTPVEREGERASEQPSDYCVMRVDVVTEQTMIYRAEFELAPRPSNKVDDATVTSRETRRPPALELRVSQMSRVLDRQLYMECS